MRIRRYTESSTSIYTTRLESHQVTYFGRRFAQTQHFQVYRQVIQNALLQVFAPLAGLLAIPLSFEQLVLEGGNRKQVLKQVIEQNERIKLQVAIVLLLQTLFDDCDEDLTDEEPLVGDELGVHGLSLVRGRLLELVHSLARAILREVLAQGLSDFAGFQSHVGMSRRN